MTEAREEGKPTRTVNAATTTCRIIDALRELDGAGVTELANHLDLSKGAIHTYLATLEQEEVVRKDGGTYRLSLRFLELGEYVKEQLPVYDVVVPELEKLADQANTRAQFVVEEYGMAIVVHIEGEDAIVPASTVGDREYLHCIASGKAIMAYLPDDRVERIIDRRGLPGRTENTITNRDELFDELEAVRERGVAFNDEEKIRGLRAVGAPITAPDGTVLGSVSVSGTTSSLQNGRFYDEVPKLAKEAANLIEFNNQVRHNG